ncbi:NAD-glutamate dehydrogenase [Chitinivorax sp. PXF-14]|uniref:NAD-glutamate dehydrogenase n=1 Tax=Chitinivorax sp. PXF-14 TaxID=3230488 RepID=UPI003466F71D
MSAFTAKQRLLEQVLEHARSALAPGLDAQIGPFIEHYYADVAEDDLIQHNPLDLFGAAFAHWQLGRARELGQALVRVYNPDFETDGWQSTHTVIEVVNDDMPFLVDSVSMALNTRGLTIHLIVHPVVALSRDDGHGYQSLCNKDAPNCRLESYMHFEVDRQSGADALKAIHDELSHVLAQVRAAVEDWRQMLVRMNDASSELTRAKLDTDEHERNEILAFLGWVADNHFTFLGYRCYELTHHGREDRLEIAAGSGLGILRETAERSHSKSFEALPAAIRKRAHDPHPLILTKSNTRATVHRTGYLDYIGIKRYSAAGKVIGEHRFLGLYTADIYNANPRTTPLLRDKVNAVLASSTYLAGSHKAKALLNVLETYPRDELLEIPLETLAEFSHGIVNLQERQRVRLFVREDVYRRYLSCLLFVPRDNWNTDVRNKVQQILLDAFAGMAAEFWVTLSESLLARIEFIIRIPTGSQPDFDGALLEAQVAQACRPWQDAMAEALIESCGEERGNQLLRKYRRAFPAAYREDFLPRHAVQDILKLEALGDDATIGLALNQALDRAHLKLFRAGEISLSRTLPMLENMGAQVLEERPYGIHLDDGSNGWITDFALQLGDADRLADEAVRSRFTETFARVFSGEAENDGLNRLILRAGLAWREVALVRAYSKYLRQAGLTFSQSYIEQCLAGHAPLVARLVRLFTLRHDPASAREPGTASTTDALVAEIRASLDLVANLDDDRILRSFLTVVLATLRTNYFQMAADGSPKPYLSFKLDSRAIDFLPLPKPMVEIWVYSPRVEGVHLRGGKVARGGLRWSDRMEDFRTEVLGLVKAQMVKNAVIVPVGSKGGFVCKQPPAGDREAVLAEGIACYQTFIRGLLDLTDNRQGSTIVPPPEVVRHDGDDPYLVVAADKGTAAFSDIANAVAAEYGFWLGDAFASGGANGYDHKKMAITARGAWESVKRHFRELGRDIQSSDFTVVGIGDMSGDVFGNGMLLSRHIRLLAAFDHRHIFLDPNPDAEASFVERERLFGLPRSSWADYDASLISAGGGIHARSAKSITPSAEACAALGLEARAMTPNELIHELLKAPVDLLYNGGIGTYVKASRQSQLDANDRGNDGLRVDGRELRCKVVGEGGNLGFTQLGRIEYALGGGRINSDAIDNSGGVDCSDHEVNIKILLNSVVAEGDLTLKHRNQLLAEMTDDVAALVLRDNYLQTAALSHSEVLAAPMLGVHARLIQALERSGKLSRRIEYLPSEEEIAERRLARQGLTRPELAVLLAYSKIELYEQLLDSPLPDAMEFTLLLTEYFPQALCQRFSDQMLEHTLKREIVATHLTNQLVNRMGLSFVFRLNEETGSPPADVARAWHAACQVFQAPQRWADIEALDNRVDTATQTALQLELRKLVERATRWMLRNCRVASDGLDIVEHYRSGVAMLAEAMPELVMGEERARCQALVQQYRAAGVPVPLLLQIAHAEPMLSTLDILDISHANQSEPLAVAGVYHDIGSRLQFDWLLSAINRLPRDNRWNTLARSALRDDLYRQQRALTALVLQTGQSLLGADAVDTWLNRHEAAVNACRMVFGELQAQPNPDLAMLSAALREVRNHLLGG